MDFSGARGTLMHEKNWDRKSRVRLPLTWLPADSPSACQQQDCLPSSKISCCQPICLPTAWLPAIKHDCLKPACLPATCVPVCHKPICLPHAYLPTDSLSDCHHTAKTKCRKFETNITRMSRSQSQFPHSCVCERIIHIFPRWVCLFCWRKICRLILGIYKSLTDRWGRAIPRKGIYNRNCRCSAAYDLTKLHFIMRFRERNWTYDAICSAWISLYTLRILFWSIMYLSRQVGRLRFSY